LKGYDYAEAGLYFITICVQDRRNLFGEIINSSDINGAPTRGARTEIKLNEAGKMVEKEWLAIAEKFPGIILHEFIIMPNHFHSIAQISNQNVGAPQVGAQTTNADAPKPLTKQLAKFMVNLNQLPQ